MWRPVFMALGITMAILGLECLVVEKATLAHEFNQTISPPNDPYALAPPKPTVVQRTFAPPEWAPWSLMSAGSIVILYAITLRKKTHDDES